MDHVELLRHMVEVGASDLHLKAGNVPFVRVDGELQPTTFPALISATRPRPPPRRSCPSTSAGVHETNEADLGYTMAGVGRFRVNVFRQRGVVGLAIRRVRSEVPTVAELRLPPVIEELADAPEV